MELLILLLLSPSVILAQRYHSGVSSPTNPNDEPFLPIYPIYPYNPKLIKRGAERDIASQLTPELYAPKLDARDSYTASFSQNYQRDPYYPNYNPYPKTSSVTGFPSSSSLPNTAYASPLSYPSTASFPATNSYSSPVSTPYSPQNAAYSTTPNAYSPYGAAHSSPYPYSPSPYAIYNAYSTPYTPANNPYPANPYAAGSYPNYNYQAPYYYPNYYNQPYPPVPPPPSPHAAQDYPENSSAEDSSQENETSGKSTTGNKSEGRKNKYKDNEPDNSGEDTKDGQYVDGANYLSSSSKDLDSQPSTYKIPSPYNSLDQLSDVRLRSVPVPGIPRTTYRVISVGGQPVGPDYPLPSTYAKVQQLEHIMSQTLAKLLAQNSAHQAAQSQYQYQNNQQGDSQSGTFATVSKPRNVIAKTGLAYAMNPTNVAKVPNSHGQFFSGFGNRQNPLVIKVQNPSQVLQQGSTVLSKAAAKYADAHYGQKPVTTVTLQQSPGVYIPPEAKNIKDESSDQSTEFNDYDSQPAQNYEGPMAANGGYKKNEQNYSLDPYHSSNLVTVQTPQAQSYQYSSYVPTQSTQQQQQQQQQPRDYKSNLDDVAFGSKRTSKE